MRYKGEYSGTLRGNSEHNSKNCLSSDCKLELVYMKSESLVIVNHDVTVNDLWGFAHTAHHARRVVTAGNFVGVGVGNFLLFRPYFRSYLNLIRL